MQEFNKTTFCRCCLLSESKNGEKLLEMHKFKFLYNNEEVQLADGYLQTTGCFLDGKLSKLSVSVSKICQLCVQQLQSAYIFRQLCLEANEILEKQYESQIGTVKQLKPPDSNHLSRQSNIYQQRMTEKILSDGEYDKFSKGGPKKPTQPKTYARAYNRRDYSVDAIKPDVRKTQNNRPPTKDGPYSCTICHKNYRLYGSLKSHKLFKHENVNNYKYHCRLCNKKCPTVFILKAHMDTHTAMPTHKCHICSASYKHRTYLLQHLKKHSDNGKKYQCLECALNFNSSRSLTFHQGRVHNEQKYSNLTIPRTAFIHKSYEELKFNQKLSEQQEQESPTMDAMHNYANEETVSTIDVVKEEVFSDEEPYKRTPLMDLDEEIYANMLVKATMPPDLPSEF